MKCQSCVEELCEHDEKHRYNPHIQFRPSSPGMSSFCKLCLKALMSHKDDIPLHYIPFTQTAIWQFRQLK